MAPRLLTHAARHPPGTAARAEALIARAAGLPAVRAAPAALDLANLVTADSAEVARYARTWRQLTGQPLPGGTIELGYRWAALQVPVQYLPWMAEHLPTGDVEAALDRIEQALDQLPA